MGRRCTREARENSRRRGERAGAGRAEHRPRVPATSLQDKQDEHKSLDLGVPGEGWPGPREHFQSC